MRDVSVWISGPDWSVLGNELFTPDGCENAAALLCGASDTGGMRRLLVRRVMPVPLNSYQDRRAYHLEISPAFYNEVVSGANRENLHVAIIHSHRMRGKAWYSQSDNYGESRLLPVLQALIPGRSVVSLVVTEDHIAGRQLTSAGFEALHSIRVLDDRVLITDNRLGAGGSVDELFFDRQIRVFGKEGQAALANLRIAVVGVGGIGSIVAEQLARVGIGRILLVDDDRVEASNLSRTLGALQSDIGSAKTDTIAKHLRTVSATSVDTLAESALGQDVVLKLRDYDAVLACVDNDRTRAVLNRFSHQYLIPVIDSGVRLDGRSGLIAAAAGRVSVVGPAFTCLRCSHHLSSARIQAESLGTEERLRLAKEGYVMGIPDAVPAVISLNATIAGLAVTALLNIFVNLSGAAQPSGQIYDARSGSVFPISAVHEPGCDVCDPIRGVKGLGDLQIVSAY